jgi:hypothetical protein
VLSIQIKIYRTITVPCCTDVKLNFSYLERNEIFREEGLKKIIGIARKEVRGGCRRELHNEKLHDVYSSPHVTGVIQSRRING